MEKKKIHSSLFLTLIIFSLSETLGGRDVPMHSNNDTTPAYWISWLVNLPRKRVLNRNLPASIKSD